MAFMQVNLFVIEKRADFGEKVTSTLYIYVVLYTHSNFFCYYMYMRNARERYIELPYWSWPLQCMNG